MRLPLVDLEFAVADDLDRVAVGRSGHVSLWGAHELLQEPIADVEVELLFLLRGADAHHRRDEQCNHYDRQNHPEPTELRNSTPLDGTRSVEQASVRRVYS